MSGFGKTTIFNVYPSREHLCILQESICVSFKRASVYPSREHLFILQESICLSFKRASVYSSTVPEIFSEYLCIT
jgi:hypothetical protein